MGLISRIRRLRYELWWRFTPGVEIKVRWPRGWVVLDEHPDGSRVSTESADPNDHYRPWIESHVGHQGWDWDWCQKDNDVALNQLTIKVRHKKAQYATIMALRWT